MITKPWEARLLKAMMGGMASQPLKVTAALIERAGCYLIALRSLGGKRGGYWEFPGGKIEPGEQPEACLQREIREELDIEVQVKSHFMTTLYEEDGERIELMAYEAQWLSGEPHPLEHRALRWLEPSAFREVAWAPPDLPIVERLLNLHGTGR